MTLLREFVSLLLREKSKDVADAGAEKLGLLKSERGSDTTYVLFRPKAVAQAVFDAKKAGRELDDLDDQIVSAIVGFIVAKPPTKGRQLDAWEIANSAADKGYGPLMYDIVMSDKGKITSDRYVVSANAQKVWKHYHDNRGDVKHVEFDDQQNPKTPPPADDAKLHRGGSDNPLNYAYSGAKVSIQSLERGFDHLLVWAKKGGISKEEITKIIQFAGAKFFRERVSAG